MSAFHLNQEEEDTRFKQTCQLTRFCLLSLQILTITRLSLRMGGHQNSAQKLKPSHELHYVSLRPKPGRGRYTYQTDLSANQILSTITSNIDIYTRQFKHGRIIKILLKKLKPSHELHYVSLQPKPARGRYTYQTDVSANQIMSTITSNIDNYTPQFKDGRIIKILLKN